ncbi:hypothetical protein BH20ACT24_BH20ACT24_12550 [soil metagenome]
MIVALGFWPALLWWVAIAGFFLVVVPVVVLVANRLVLALRQIRSYATDILEHGVGLAGNLDPVPELATTRDRVKQVGAGLGRYGAALGEIL